MLKCTHDAADKKLSKKIATHNDAISQHAQNEGAISQPPAIPDDELPTITVGIIETHRAGLRSETLTHLQNAVNLGRQRIELLEAIESELSAQAESADESYNAVHQKVADALTKAGLGLESMPASAANYESAAQRQFEVSVRASKDVQAAEKEKRYRRGQLANHVQMVAGAKADLQDAITELRSFVHTHITGESHHGKQQAGHTAKFVG